MRSWRLRTLREPGFHGEGPGHSWGLTMAAAGDSLRRRAGLALVVGLASFAVSGASYVSSRPLGALGGIADEWFRLGTNLAIHGTLGVDREPVVYRPPGYPLFVAAVLRAYVDVPAAGNPEANTPAFQAAGADAVYISQCLLLAVASSVVFLWLALGVSVELAFLGGLLFGTNPYSVALTTFLHYDVLHLLLLVASCLALEAAFERPYPGRVLRGRGRVGPRHPGAAGDPGVSPRSPCGSAWPGRGPIGPGRFARRGATAAMAAVIAPWTARNYAVTGHLIPVNAQTWQATWGTTVAPLGAHPDRYKWFVIARDHYRPSTWRWWARGSTTKRSRARTWRSRRLSAGRRWGTFGAGRGSTWAMRRRPSSASTWTSTPSC